MPELTVEDILEVAGLIEKADKQRKDYIGTVGDITRIVRSARPREHRVTVDTLFPAVDSDRLTIYEISDVGEVVVRLLMESRRTDAKVDGIG